MAFQGIQTEFRAIASQVISNNSAIFVFMSANQAPGHNDIMVIDVGRQLLSDIDAHLRKHGDAVKDVADKVDDAMAVCSNSIAR